VKILILSNRVPFPQNGGYPIVVRNTILGLVNEGHEVSVFTLNNKKQLTDIQNDDELIRRIHYQSYDFDMSLSFKGFVLNLFGTSSYNIDRFYVPGFEKMLVTELKRVQYDIIQFEGLFMSTYLDAVRKNTKAKLIYRAHNIEHLIWKRLSEQKSDPIKKSYLRVLAKRIKKYELSYLDKFDAIAALTGQDKQSMLDYDIKIPVRVLPVGIDLTRYKPDYEKTEYPSLFFLGALDWMPNREGMEWFLENFSADLCDGDLKVRFYVAGHNIPEAFDDYEVLGKIFIQGEVDHGLEFVNSKAIMIVPLLSGGGMRVKIVEGMAMQKCIITTTLGAEGIRYKHGHNILIANDREEFHSAIKRAITDEDFCRQIGLNARMLVEQEHDTKVVTAQMIAFYKEILKA
jgi:glycosyltransferase involved in cell wall biosynthesis